MEGDAPFINEATHEVYREGNLIELSPTEFTLLRYLLINAGRVVSKSQILDHVWDFEYDGLSNVVDQYVSYLRKKIDKPFGRNDLRTVRGVGYRLSLSAGA